MEGLICYHSRHLQISKRKQEETETGNKRLKAELKKNVTQSLPVKWLPR